MTLPRFNVLPQEAGYSATGGARFHYADLDGGRGRRRRRFIGTTNRVSVTFLFDTTEYGYWEAFRRTAISEGSLPFLLDLILDTPDPVTYEVALMPDSVQMQPNGDARIVQMELEVKPLPVDTEFDLATLAAFEAGGDLYPDLLARLAVFVNEDAPAAIGV